MHIIISALHFDWETLPGCLAWAQAHGLDGVELSWHASFSRPHCTHADLDELARLPVLSGHIRTAHIWEDPIELQNSLALWLAECRRTHTTQLVLHGGAYPSQVQGIARLQGALAVLLPACRTAGVTLNLENHYAYSYHNLHELLSEPWEFAALPDDPALRLCYDTGHSNMTHNTADLLHAMGRRLNYVHLADNMGTDDDHLPFRRGTVAWDLVFDSLQRMLFDGVICVEFPVRGDMAPFERCLAEIYTRWPALKRR